MPVEGLHGWQTFVPDANIPVAHWRVYMVGQMPIEGFITWFPMFIPDANKGVFDLCFAIQKGT
jgi:hypothetical protein